MKPKNIEAGIKLIERYRSITIDEIKKTWEKSYYSGATVAKKLTGYSSTELCSLCRAVRGNCDLCFYTSIDAPTISVFCVYGKSKKSYDDIGDSETPRQLLNAFRRRANYIEKVLNNIQ